jgi:hypothetical protein
VNAAGGDRSRGSIGEAEGGGISPFVVATSSYRGERKPSVFDPGAEPREPGVSCAFVHGASLGIAFGLPKTCTTSLSMESTVEHVGHRPVFARCCMTNKRKKLRVNSHVRCLQVGALDVTFVRCDQQKRCPQRVTQGSVAVLPLEFVCPKVISNPSTSKS